ncbi:MAG: isochorismatase family cysteine hydrolase, partial [Candidatus Eremiobacterota bacterium]
MSGEFLAYLEELRAGRKPLALEDLVQEAGGPDRVAVVTVDLIRGFCTIGPLASPRIQAAVPVAARILRRAYNLGVRDFFFPQDAHPPDSPEFQAFPPHCIRDSAESEMVPELAGLPFAEVFQVLPKESVSSHHGTDLHDRLVAGGFTRIVAMGDCTDIC